MAEIIPEQVGGLDYSDELASGFRFAPTDAELIVDYLKAKMESRDHPKCRLHEVNIYNHSPDQLAEGYRSHDNVWYYLTPRDRKYPKGDRPDRAVGGGFGFWKATQKHKDVYDDKTGEMVGHKTSLAFYITKDEEKTKWLMHEYTTIEPNLPPNTNTNTNNNKLNEWVLSKIYYKKKKKEEPNKLTTTSKPIKKVKKKVIQEPKRTRVPKRRRVSTEENHREENVPQQEETNNPHLNLDTNTHHDIQMEPMTHPTPMLQQGQGSSVVYNNIINIDDGDMQPPQSQCYFTSNATASNNCQISIANSSPQPQPQPQPLDDHYTTTTPAAATEHGLIPESNNIYDQNYSEWLAQMLSNDDDDIVPDEVVQSRFYKDLVQDLPSTYSACEARLLSDDDDDDIFIQDEVFQSQFEDQQPDASASAYDDATADHPLAVEEVEWSFDTVEQHCADL